MYYSDVDWTLKLQKGALKLRDYNATERTVLRILGASKSELWKRVTIIYDWSDVLIALFTLLQAAVPVV